MILLFYLHPWGIKITVTLPSSTTGLLRAHAEAGHPDRERVGPDIWDAWLPHTSSWRYRVTAEQHTPGLPLVGSSYSQPCGFISFADCLSRLERLRGAEKTVEAVGPTLLQWVSVNEVEALNWNTRARCQDSHFSCTYFKANIYESVLQVLFTCTSNKLSQVY